MVILCSSTSEHEILTVKHHILPLTSTVLLLTAMIWWLRVNLHSFLGATLSGIRVNLDHFSLLIRQ